MATIKEAQRRPAPASVFESLAALEGPKAIAAVKAGLDARLIRKLADELDLGLEELAGPLNLTERTLHRRLGEGHLALDESERLLGLIKILSLAKQTLGSATKAVHWFKSPLPVLR